MLVEGEESGLGERPRRTQFASTERRQRPPRVSNILRNLREAFGQRQQAIETHTLDLETGISRRAARILKDRRDETIIAGWKIARHVWRPSSLESFIPEPLFNESLHRT
jgi:hypothetical protein